MKIKSAQIKGHSSQRKDTRASKTEKSLYNSPKKDTKTKTNRRTKFKWTNKKVYNTLTLQPKVQKVLLILLGPKFFYNARNHKRLDRFLQAQEKHSLLYTSIVYTKQQTRI